MAILANRVRTKSHLIEITKFVTLFIRRAFVPILVLLSCFILYFSYPKTLVVSALDSIGKTLSLGTIIYNESINVVKSAYSRFSYFQDLEAENLRLKLEIASLAQAKELAASMQAENVALKEILNVLPELESKFVTARIVGTTMSPFTSSAIIRAGASDNIKVDYIAKGVKGLLGRVTEVGANYSTVMLINDHNSRIPVVTENSKVRGILAKQGDNLKVIYLQENHGAKVGEIIFTSGDGKLFPKGIPVAKIIKVTDREAFVEILDDLSKVDFVVVTPNHSNS